jgi:hypothetical protein
MQNYIGKNCPYCQFPFKPGVPVVFCSDCEVPHHRECWDENGRCTTYGCNGQPTLSSSASASSSTIDLTTDLTRENVATKRCPYCGEEILESAIKCKHCQSMLSSKTKEKTIPTDSNSPTEKQGGDGECCGCIIWIIIIIIILGLLGSL